MSKTARLLRGSGFKVLFKVVALFFVFIAVLGIFGKLRFPGQTRLAQAKCTACGRYRIGKGPCAFGRGPRG